MATSAVLAAIAYPPLDPVAIRIGPFAVHWYGIAYLAGFIAATLVLRSLARRWKLNLTGDDVLNIMLAAIIGVVVGGRIGYVLFYGGGYYWSQPSRMLYIWDGGMSFHGGLIGILVAGAIVARLIGMPLLTLWDLGAVGAPVGLGAGRVANFVNAELWGRVTDVSWGVVFPGAGPLPRHPSQLYEAFLEGAVLLAVMLVLAWRLPPRPRGELIGWLLALYGAFRVFAEFFREPDPQLSFVFGGWATMGMVLSVPMVIAGVSLIVWARARSLPQQGRPPE